MTRKEIEELLDGVKYRDWHCFVDERRKEPYFQFRFWAPNLDGKSISLRFGRRWPVVPGMSKADVVKTALAAVLEIEGKLARERFLFMGAAIFSPHYDPGTLAEVARDTA
jgi:hypothetical protein